MFNEIYKTIEFTHDISGDSSTKLLPDIKISDVIYTGENVGVIEYPEGTTYNEVRDKTKREKDIEKYNKRKVKKYIKPQTYKDPKIEPFTYEHDDIYEDF